MTRIKLTFIVYGDMFDIDEFSKIINISPTEFAYKGDKLKFRISTDTFWKYSFKDIISLFVEDSFKASWKNYNPKNWGDIFIYAQKQLKIYNAF